MMALSLKEKLQRGETVYGLFNSIPHPLVIEMIAASGYDFVIIDTEHTAINDETLEHMIRAAETASITPVVRVTQSIERDIIKVLDMGARGIIVPHVESKARAEEIVKLSRYYPEGMRSLNGGRMPRFGEMPLTDYMAEANNSIVVIAMIESQQGLNALDDIASVNGIDMIIEGAADLSQSFGKPWQTTDEVVQKATAYMYKITTHHHKAFIALPREHAQFKAWKDKGVKAFVLGDDRGKLYRHLKQDLLSYKGGEPL
ncbi:TPA: HpcH/HpaI aldolase/citrate lyase family protein [Staphylococcus aureus]|uniref:HpcH/HpaI aldolase family protein n=1 Tax=Staphylococcus agnetis TaxID=985762 RepID=UPI00118AE1A7|nr:HpcH/HpaI aldolase/citrate lyase family protein [Staphylococcus agnetis]QDW97709.1 siderophore biosynthesis protein SbnG [Staphylococcus agnetis]HEF0711350.1 HpcH/HpaI aldolase/citrate lyase family protein [Staphylococcus aureus]